MCKYGRIIRVAVKSLNLGKSLTVKLTTMWSRILLQVHQEFDLPTSPMPDVSPGDGAYSVQDHRTAVWSDGGPRRGDPSVVNGQEQPVGRTRRRQ